VGEGGAGGSGASPREPIDNRVISGTCARRILGRNPTPCRGLDEEGFAARGESIFWTSVYLSGTIKMRSARGPSRASRRRHKERTGQDDECSNRTRSHCHCRRRRSNREPRPVHGRLRGSGASIGRPARSGRLGATGGGDLVRAIVLSAAECREWAATERVSRGPKDLPARTIRRARALMARTGQSHVQVWAGHVVVLLVGRDGVAAGCAVPLSLRGEGQS
jgi:hypothetical protein